MDIIEGLQKLGFTTYEAKTYKALVKEPNLTGYQVGKESGVPKSKVYEVLKDMVEKGYVVVTNEKNKKLYQPVPYQILLSRHQAEIDNTIAGLEEEFDNLEVDAQEPPLSTVRGRKNIIKRVKEMCNEAEENILIGGFSPDLKKVLSELQEAENKGVDLYLLQFGKEDLELRNQFFHKVSSKQERQIEQYGKWFTVVKDMDEVLLAQFRQQGATALWTRNMAVVMTLSMWIQHDISYNVLLEKIGDQELASQLLEEVNTELAGLWNLGFNKDN